MYYYEDEDTGQIWPTCGTHFGDEIALSLVGLCNLTY